MAIGDDHQVPIIVGVEVHDDKPLGASEEDKVLPVLILFRLFAEYAFRTLFRENILHSPGCPHWLGHDVLGEDASSLNPPFSLSNPSTFCMSSHTSHLSLGFLRR